MLDWVSAWMAWNMVRMLALSGRLRTGSDIIAHTKIKLYHPHTVLWEQQTYVTPWRAKR